MSTAIAQPPRAPGGRPPAHAVRAGASPLPPGARAPSWPRGLQLRAARFVRQLAGREPWIGPQVRVPTLRLGTWAVCPGALGHGARVYSAGVDRDLTFELELVRRWDAAVFAFDPTPGVAERLAQRAPPPGLHLRPAGLASADGAARFFPRVGRDGAVAEDRLTTVASAGAAHRGVTLPVQRLESAMAELHHQSIDLLKLDLGGAEYEVLDQLLAAGIPVRQLLVEFHHRFEGIGPARTADAVARLTAAGYRLFFVSENGQEYAFLRVP